MDGYADVRSDFDILQLKNEIMSESAREFSAHRRGTILLEAFEECLPNFNNLDEKQHLQFIKAIDLLSNYLKVKQNRPESREFPTVIDGLRQLYNRYRDNNVVIASAIFVVMTHFESYYLDDQDAKLVHHLTGLHIYRPIDMSATEPNSLAK
jgi:hypothetical protein